MQHYEYPFELALTLDALLKSHSDWASVEAPVVAEGDPKLMAAPPASGPPGPPARMPPPPAPPRDRPRADVRMPMATVSRRALHHLTPQHSSSVLTVGIISSWAVRSCYTWSVGGRYRTDRPFRGAHPGGWLGGRGFVIDPQSVPPSTPPHWLPCANRRLPWGGSLAESYVAALRVSASPLHFDLPACALFLENRCLEMRLDY